eukprot:TRINITY_DN15993_c0_g1_i1.p1 TRINITY_DN15993_c0_g1~~TRINITY_DN15993_c0_g1_i1.p1  ORF type:complete len:116 (+),score=18.03 TRINITY_DN15993_c0_g1_i1:209-556(+)
METCWNSHQGSPQSILLAWNNELVSVSKLVFVFQGGFVGKDCKLEVYGKTNDKPEDHWRDGGEINLEDNNREQTFSVSLTDVKRLKIIFQKSTDFYGRVTLYKLDILGSFQNSAQ